MSHRLFQGGMNGQVIHDDPTDLAPLTVILAGDMGLSIMQALPFEGRSESITTTLAGLRDLLALAEELEKQR